MNPIHLIPITVLLAATAAAADTSCPRGSDTLMTCTFRGGAKTVSVCLSGQAASYRYGPTRGQPELQLDRKVTEVDYTPWPGIGRSIWEEAAFSNQGVRYTVWYSIDKMVEGPGKIQGGIVVGQGDKELARLDCDTGSVDGVLYGDDLLHRAKEAAGQVYCRDVQQWRRSCG